MTQHTAKPFILGATLFVTSALLAGCSVVSPPELVVSSQAAPRSLSEITLLQPDEKQTEAVAFHAALVRQLDARGVTLSPNAGVVAEMSVATRSTSTGLYTNEAGKVDGEATALTGDEADVRKARWYDACRAASVRATLALFDRSTGEALGTSTAQSTICEKGQPDYSALARLLVSDALGR